MKPLIAIALPWKRIVLMASLSPKGGWDTLLRRRRSLQKRARFKTPLLFWIPLFLSLTSCGIYQNRFDCPPGKGIGCAPVGEVLDLIVEKEEGEDLFVKDKGTALLLRREKEDKLPSHPKRPRKRSYLIKDEAGRWRVVELSRPQPGKKPKKEGEKCPS